MTPLEKIKVLAELDGWTRVKWQDGGDSCFFEKEGEIDRHIEEFSYLESYNAVLPLVRKWCSKNIDNWIIFIQKLALVMGINTFSSGLVSRYALQATPDQLSNALIKAAGMWKDDV